MDIRRFIIILMIAVIYTVLVRSSIDAIYPMPEYENCGYKSYPVVSPVAPETCPEVAWSQEEADTCVKNKGYYEPIYRDGKCVDHYECSMCQFNFDQERQKRGQVSFFLSALFALIAILIGLYLPTANPLNEWVGFGFILGGLFSLFFGTFEYYQDMGRFLRPIVMAAELGIVLFVTYKKINLYKEESTPKKKK